METGYAAFFFISFVMYSTMPGSCPELNVPDAGITGFFNVMPAISTDVFIPSASFLESHDNNWQGKIKVLSFFVYSAENDTGIKKHSTLNR